MSNTATFSVCMWVAAVSEYRNLASSPSITSTTQPPSAGRTALSPGPLGARHSAPVGGPHGPQRPVGGALGAQRPVGGALGAQPRRHQRLDQERLHLPGPQVAHVVARV